MVAKLDGSIAGALMMKKLMVSADLIELGFIRGVLESEGILCIVKNEFLNGALGELPVNETWPELWVSSEDWPRADQIMISVKEDAGAGENWRCKQCGEMIEAQFAACWRCSTNVKRD